MRRVLYNKFYINYAKQENYLPKTLNAKFAKYQCAEMKCIYLSRSYAVPFYS